MQLPVVMAVQVRGDHLFCLERPAGAEQFLLTRRSAVDPDADTVRARRPGRRHGRRGERRSTGSRRRRTARLVAVGTSEGGTEDSVLRVLDAADGRDLGEAIPHTRACSVAWEPDGSGFAYTRYPEGDQYHRTVHHHRLGERWEDDPVLWAEHPDPQAWPDVTHLAGRGVAARPRARRLVAHRRAPARPVDRHVDDGDRGRRGHVRAVFAADGAALVGVTTLDAPRGRVVRAPLDAPTSLGDARRRG